MRSIFAKAALAAALLTATAAGTSAASADQAAHRWRGWHDHDGCGHACRVHGGWGPAPFIGPFGCLDLGGARYLDALPPPPAVRTARPVYGDSAQNPQLGVIMHQPAAGNRALDGDRAGCVVSPSEFHRLKGEAQAITGETRALDRREPYVSGAQLSALRGEVSRLTRSVDRIA